MILKIHHSTRYTYDQPVPYALQQLRVTPKTKNTQKIHKWDVSVSGGAKMLQFDDHHENTVELISCDENTTEITILCDGVVEVNEAHGITGDHSGFAPLWLYLRGNDVTKAGTRVRKVTSSLTGTSGSLEWLHELSSAVREAVTYKPNSSEVGWTAEQALEAGHGVCQDHAHVFIACCRHAGIPARYISGYLMMNDRVEQDATHAWAEANIDGLGWVGFDVSNGISPDTRYVRVATGLDYTEAAPVSGTRFGDTRESLSVQVQVQQ